MIYSHSLGRAAQYYGERIALSIDGKRLTFRELHSRVERIAAGLNRRGLRTGDRLAILLPNGPEYIELVYACSRLGVIVVPLNPRYSPREIDRVLKDTSPRGLVRRSGSAPFTVKLAWQLVLEEEPLDAPNGSCPEVFYSPEAILVIIYTSGTTGEPKSVMLTHTNVLANIQYLNYWMRYRQGGAYLHAAPIFHGADFPAMFAAPTFGALQVTVPRFSPRAFCEAVEKERITHTLLAPTMLNTLTNFSGAKQFDLSSLEVVAFGGSPMRVELYRRTRRLLSGIKLVHLYGTAETGFLTGLEAPEGEDIVGERRLGCARFRSRTIDLPWMAVFRSRYGRSVWLARCPAYRASSPGRDACRGLEPNPFDFRNRSETRRHSGRPRARYERLGRTCICTASFDRSSRARSG